MDFVSRDLVYDLMYNILVNVVSDLLNSFISEGKIDLVNVDNRLKTFPWTAGVLLLRHDKHFAFFVKQKFNFCSN